MGADLKKLVTDHLSEIGHFHIADVPGRQEPGTGSVDWAAILRHNQDRGYAGCVGFEYFPESDSDASLETIHKLWEANIAVRL
jgi:hydroxypyruvate isomerase